MKLSILPFLGTAAATILLGRLEENIIIGQSLQLEAYLSQPYLLELVLVQKGTEPNVAWTTVDELFVGIKEKKGLKTFTVNVNETWPTSKNGELYALWLDGSNLDGKGGGWSALSNWFSVNEPKTDSETETLLKVNQELV